MSSVSMKHAAEPAPAPVEARVEASDPSISLLGFGQGALADADILKEAAGLRALHAAQEHELEHDACPVTAAVQVPRALLSLFRHAAPTYGESNVLPRP